MISFEPKVAEAIALACLDPDPVNFRNISKQEVKRVVAAIRRAAPTHGASFRYDVTRKHFLCGCLEFTEHLDEEHLIVGYGYRHATTTSVKTVHHAIGEKRRVAVPDYIRARIRQHHFHRTDAEVIVFHNHLRTGQEPGWFYMLKSLLQDVPIASHDDRRELQHHAFSPVGLLRHFFGQGRVLFFLGESGFVREFRLPPVLPFLDQLSLLSARPAV